MSYTVGIGALVDGETFNKVRSLELTIAAATGSYTGLGQPPHITVKRPFQIGSVDDIAKLQSLVADIARTTPAFTVVYGGLDNFDDTALFLAVAPSRNLEILHETLLSKLQTTFGSVEAPHEGTEMVYHTSVALGLQGGQAQQLVAKLDNSLPTSCIIHKLGIFLGLDDNTHWSIISEIKLA